MNRNINISLIFIAKKLNEILILHLNQKFPIWNYNPYRHLFHHTFIKITIWEMHQIFQNAPQNSIT